VSEERRLDWHTRRVRATVPLQCAECGKVSAPDAAGWSAMRTGEIDPDGTLELIVYCAQCAERKFGS
jgi:hypothetical protein